MTDNVGDPVRAMFDLRGEISLKVLFQGERQEVASEYVTLDWQIKENQETSRSLPSNTASRILSCTRSLPQTSRPETDPNVGQRSLTRQAIFCRTDLISARQPISPATMVYMI